MRGSKGIIDRTELDRTSKKTSQTENTGAEIAAAEIYLTATDQIRRTAILSGLDERQVAELYIRAAGAF